MPFVENLGIAHGQSQRQLHKLDSGQVFERLGIDSDEDLFLLMAHARLPMPRLPEAETERMVDQLMQLDMDQP